VHAEKDAFKIACDHGMDYRVEWFAGYDDANLYVCARVFDDQFVGADHPQAAGMSDRIELRFDLDVAGDLLVPSAADDVTVWLTPGGTGGRLAVEIEDGAGRRALPGAAGAFAVWDDPEMLKGWEPWPHPGPAVGYLIEAAVPWKDLGVTPRPGLLLGFDVLGHETDLVKGRVEASVLRWAGGARPTGQLRLEE
jgi:hypothetical protein